MYDAIIVGARCGGAPLAMLLARSGHRVLLLDRMSFGSDIMSTHYVKRTGASLLQRWGLLEQIDAAGTPAIRRHTFHVDDLRLEGVAPAHDGLDRDVTPRRYVLDRILIDAAVDAGVEARDEVSVKQLEFDGGRVCGVRAITRTGEAFSARAHVVIGADGPRSLVAAQAGAGYAVNAGSYTCCYYAYYSGMRSRDDTASLHLLTDQRRFYITFPTNDELDMVLQFWPREEAARVRRDLPAEYDRNLQLVPELEARTRAGKRETGIVGTHLLPNYFRRAHGPGWALVGDAALHRDPLTAQGITNAFTHAQILFEELDLAFAGEQTIDAATAAFDTRQTAALKPLFDYTVHMAMMQPMLPALRDSLPQVAADQSATNAFIGAFLGSVPLHQVFPPSILEAFEADVNRGHAVHNQAA